MKTWILIIAIIASILVLDGIASRQLESVSDQMTQQVDELTQAVEAENWEQAQSLEQKLSSDWERTSHSLQKYLDHSEMETVDIIMARVQAMTQACEKADLLPELSELSRDISHLKQRYKLALENVF